MCIKILFFRVLVTVESGHSLLTVRYHELFETKNSIVILLSCNVINVMMNKNVVRLICYPDCVFLYSKIQNCPPSKFTQVTLGLIFRSPRIRPGFTNRPTRPRPRDTKCQGMQKIITD